MRPKEQLMIRRLTARASLALLAAALAACADSAAPASGATDPSHRAFDVVDAAPLAWQSPATPGTLRDAVLFWNDVTTAFFHPPVFVPGQPPPLDARGYAMASVATHDALNAIDRRYEPLIFQGTATSRLSGEAAIAAAVRGVLVGLGRAFPTPAPVAYANAQYDAYVAGIPAGPEKAAGIALGEAVAAAILADRATDGSAGPPATPYVSPGGAGDFRPIIPNPVGLRGVAALQQWGRVRPFVLTSPTQFRSGAPYGAASLAAAARTPEYLADYDETKRLGGIVSERTDDQTDVALFWMESNAQSWNRVARTILDRRQQTAWRTARLLAHLHLALADGFFASLESKYHWTFWRPITAIRLGNLGASPADPAWDVLAVPALGRPTPPTPEWPAEGAMASGAGAEVIAAHVPGTTAFAMETSTLPGKPRRYGSVDEAAQDDARSRIYVGYSWRAATVEGDLQGRRVARYVLEHSLQPVRPD
jgi:hypothetical protein